MFRSLMLLSCFAFLSLNLTAQSAWVSGIMVEKESKEAIPGVKIYQGDQLLTTTDANGAFSVAFEKGDHDFFAKFFSSRTLVHIELIDLASYNLGPIPLDVEDEGAGFKKSFSLSKKSQYFVPKK